MKIHFWELPPKRNYIILKREYKRNLINKLELNKYSWKIKNKINKGKISVEKIKAISKKENIPLSLIEQNIIWIGGNNSKGLSNPKFPINLISKNAARFIAGIINDGTLTKESSNGKGKGRLMYDNFDKSLRKSILKDYTKTFGGKESEVAFRFNEKKQYLEFSSVIRDLIELIIISKGPKCESNLFVPDFILENKECMVGWIEQTIADEGEVKYYPDKYRRSIIWRRALDVTEIYHKKIERRIPISRLPEDIKQKLKQKRCNLIKAEERMLNSLGIDYKLSLLEIYPTTKNKIRTKWEIMLTKRENLLKLRNLIKIPSKLKDEKFSLITKEFIRYKEPLKIKEKVINLGKIKGNFTSIDIKEAMNYKRTNSAITWLKKFEKEGLIKKVKESEYGSGDYRKPAEYQIILNI